MALVLKVNGVDRSSYVKWPTIAKTEVLTKEVDRMEFEITKTPSKSVLPAVNDEVTLEEDAVKIFGGVIVERNERVVGGVLIGYEYKCKDYSQYLDRKLVVKNYVGYTARDIFIDILNTYTTGFTHVNIPADTPVVPTVKFNYEQPTRCLAKVCDLIGWDWFVDYDKDIHLFSADTTLAPFNITDTNDNMEWATLEINNTILQLKNVIYVRGGDYEKEYTVTNTPDKYKGNGTQQTFPLAYQYAAITVEVNSVIVTVGTDQMTDPSTVDAIYNFNEKFVQFTNLTINNGDIVKMYGTALIPIIGLVRDNVSIATYGEYQAVVVDKTITSIEEAQARARAEAVKYAQSVFEGSFKTTKTGLRTGQSINITSAVRGTNKTFKINRIVGKSRTSGTMEYTVSLIASGQVNFTDIMVELLTKDNKNIDIQDNEVLQRLEYFIEEFGVTDTVHTPTKTSGPYVWDTMKWNLFTWS